MNPLSDASLARLAQVVAIPDPDAARYRVLEVLGEGGMGIVHLADDLLLGRRVALKVLALERLTPDGVERMQREARILARLEHPGIVPIHDVGTMPDGRVYYAMKWVRGRRLDEVAASLPLRERLRLFLQVCDAVAFAHAEGVVHRDLKPSNVMVGAYGEVLTMDWGLALLHGPADANAAGPHAAERAPSLPAAAAPDRTQDGAVIGTPGFMAPEQARGDVRAIDARADVYGLGATLQALTVVPVAGAGGAIALPPRPLRSIIARACAAEPAARYASVRALAGDVQRWLDGARVEAHEESLWERLARVAEPHRTAIVLVAVYLVMRGLLATIYRR